MPVPPFPEAPPPLPPPQGNMPPSVVSESPPSPESRTSANQTEDLEKVCRSVEGESDEEAEMEVESSEDPKLGKSMDAKGCRLIEEVEGSYLSLTAGGKADLSSENGEVSQVDKKKLGSSLADQPTSSSKNSTNPNTTP
ncbi:hypothetical protein HOY82DRAFT_611944 [Tuber indicum]|nr:hypothetical protein HOY82DRAFT_611944 [Tuber indicum]